MSIQKLLWKNVLYGGLWEDGNLFCTVIFAFRGKGSDDWNSDPVMAYRIFRRDLLSHTLFCFPYPLNNMDLRGSTTIHFTVFGFCKLVSDVFHQESLYKNSVLLLDPT
jgi:hypothetical protein